MYVYSIYMHTKSINVGSTDQYTHTKGMKCKMKMRRKWDCAVCGDPVFLDTGSLYLSCCCGEVPCPLKPEDIMETFTFRTADPPKTVQSSGGKLNE